jgi:hypothetical protein
LSCVQLSWCLAVAVCTLQSNVVAMGLLQAQLLIVSLDVCPFASVELNADMACVLVS